MIFLYISRGHFFKQKRGKPIFLGVNMSWFEAGFRMVKFGLTSLPEAMNTSERGYNLFVIFFSLLVVGAVAGIP